MRPTWRALIAMLLLGGTIIWLPTAIDQSSRPYDSSTAALAASNPRHDNGSDDDKNNQPGYDPATGTMTDDNSSAAATSNDNGTANTGNDNGMAVDDNDNVAAGGPPPAPAPAPGDDHPNYHIPNQP